MVSGTAATSPIEPTSVAKISVATRSRWTASLNAMSCEEKISSSGSDAPA
jgi:hypothetical protein